jgi:hypothetical protein
LTRYANPLQKYFCGVVRLWHFPPEFAGPMSPSGKKWFILLLSRWLLPLLPQKPEATEKRTY